MLQNNWIGIALALLSFGINYGVLQARSNDADRRISDMEKSMQDQRKDMEAKLDQQNKQDLIVVEKLTKLETQMEFVYSKAKKEAGLA